MFIYLVLGGKVYNRKCIELYEIHDTVGCNNKICKSMVGFPLLKKWIIKNTMEKESGSVQKSCLGFDLCSISDDGVSVSSVFFQGNSISCYKCVIYKDLV